MRSLTIFLLLTYSTYGESIQWGKQSKGLCLGISSKMSLSSNAIKLEGHFKNSTNNDIPLYLSPTIYCLEYYSSEYYSSEYKTKKGLSKSIGYGRKLLDLAVPFYTKTVNPQKDIPYLNFTKPMKYIEFSDRAISDTLAYLSKLTSRKIALALKGVDE